MPLFTQWIAEEANEASRIKSELPIMVVLGNPPYSGISMNTNDWIDGLMEDYKVTVRDEERQIQRLSNDYVKFIRFAQWRLQETGQGVLAFITDRGYLDGLLFRDMRNSLLNSFSEIYIFDLHGVAVRGKSRASDQNVFDISQGVAISIFIKKTKQNGPAEIKYAEVFGSRETKYRVLASSEIATTTWQKVTPRTPHWHFVPTSADVSYESLLSLLDVIGTGIPKADRDKRYGTGIKTRHDDFVVGWSPDDAVGKVRRIAHRSEPDSELIDQLGLCTTKHFDIRAARKRAEQSDLVQYVRPIAFRPFDSRYIVYLREFICEPKAETMRHLLRSDNMAMAILRRDRKELGTGYFVVRGLIAKDFVSNIDDALIWPLYLDSASPNRQKSLAYSDTAVRQPNLASAFVDELVEKLAMAFRKDEKGDLIKTFGPEDIFDYMYAVFHSPTYRSRYAEFLKIDFPRLPLTSNAELFRKLCALGSELVALHLMEKNAPTITTYPVVGANEVEKVRYTAPGEAGAEVGRVWINREQYFEGVPPELWNFHVGGYQVLQKWLKDRKSHKLTYDDLTHYQHVVSALNETIRLMTEIDAVIEKHGGWPIT